MSTQIQINCNLHMLLSDDEANSKTRKFAYEVETRKSQTDVMFWLTLFPKREKQTSWFLDVVD